MKKNETLEGQARKCVTMKPLIFTLARILGAVLLVLLFLTACTTREERELSAKNAKAADQREERLVSTAQMEARKVILAAKQDVVEEAYALALEKLCTMPEDKYITVLSDLLVQASASGTEEAVFSAKDRPGVGKAAVEKANAASGKHLTLSDQTADIRGGFILKDRNVEVNCAFETLVRLQKAETAGAVVKKLF